MFAAHCTCKRSPAADSQSTNERRFEPWGIFSRNRLLIVSLAIAASGILTCGMALADIFLPHGTAIFVLVSIPAIAVGVFAMLFAFAWTCEMLDRRGYLRRPIQIGGEAKGAWQIVLVREPLQPSERQPVLTIRKPLRPLIDYPVNLRGRATFSGRGWASGSQGP